MKNKKNAFTLVELLAVIVILAVILVIAIPQIIKTIEAARLGSFKSTAKLLITQAEKQYLVDQTLKVDGGSIGETTYEGVGNGDTECGSLAKLGSDYSNCKITVDASGKATLVTLTGKNKFANYSCSNATMDGATSVDNGCGKESSSSSSESETSLACATEYCYLFGSYIRELTEYEIDEEHCVSAAQTNLRFDETQATTFCSSKTAEVNGRSLQGLYEQGYGDTLASMQLIIPTYGGYNSDIKTDWKQVQKPVFLKFKNDLSEKYTCTTYNIGDGEPVCIKENAFNEYTNATDKTGTQWNNVITLFGHTEENPVCSVSSSDVYCIVHEPMGWHCSADARGVGCDWSDDSSTLNCYVVFGSAYCLGE